VAKEEAEFWRTKVGGDVVLMEFTRFGGVPWEVCRPMVDPGGERVRATFVLETGRGGVHGDHPRSWFLGEGAVWHPPLSLVRVLAVLVPCEEDGYVVVLRDGRLGVGGRDERGSSGLVGQAVVQGAEVLWLSC
jgi:hypothetical protein